MYHRLLAINCHAANLHVHEYPKMEGGAREVHGRARVAHCVSGLTRSLTLPLVYQSLKYHLVDAFGGEPAVFLMLKAWSTASKVKGVFDASAANDVRHAWTEEEHNRLLQPVVELLQPVAIKFGNLSAETPGLLINQQCSIVDHRGGSQGMYRLEGGLVRMVGQMLSQHTCLGMIEEHEARRRVAFDWVTLTRPDLGVLQPVLPWCAYADRMAEHTPQMTPHEIYFTHAKPLSAPHHSIKPSRRHPSNPICVLPFTSFVCTLVLQFWHTRCGALWLVPRG
jgi:hypothetical protein